MGQSSSSSIQEFVSNSFAKIISDDTSYSIAAEEIPSMSYDEFLLKLGELNKLSQSCLDSTGKQLLFAVKKGSDSTLFWKATVQVACVKVDPHTQKVCTYRLLNLKEFLQVFRTLSCQHSAAEQSKRACGWHYLNRQQLLDHLHHALNTIMNNDCNMTVSTFYDNISALTKENTDSLDTGTECCICFERKPDILLPCAHSYCLPCIEEWNEDHHTCPICRENLQSTDDTWVLSEVPKAEEISEEIRSTLMHLADEKNTNPCKQS